MITDSKTIMEKILLKKIEILKPEVIDQIAAGEVVERPSHLVKELIENSIDAGATEIEVEFDLGGKKVRITDNGSGIAKEDLVLALSRHATSKIKASEDLWHLNSFGFRGEALASISSVSHFSLRSKLPQDAFAHQIFSEYGRIDKEIESCGGEQGTSIYIDNLFGNVPARLKFLKSDAAESSQIKNVLKAMAMSHPEVSFRIRHKGQLLYYWPAQETYLERVKQVLNLKSLYAGEAELEGLKCRCITSSPNETTGNSRQIWMFANGRWVQDRSIQAAVVDAYRSLLMHGEFPYAAIWVDSPADEIDVNIHPTKSQVKFKRSSDIFRVVSRSVRSVLEKAPWLQEFLPEKHNDFCSKDEGIVQTGANENKTIIFDLKESFNHELESHPILRWGQDLDLHHSPPMNQDPFLKTNYQTKEFPPVSSQAFSPQALSHSQNQSDKDSSGLLRWSHLHVLGQAALTYIVSQSEDSIIFVDQHAAHERVVYERLMKNWEEGGIEVQNFLIPLSIDLSEDEVEAILSQEEGLTKVGLEIDQLGPQTLGIRSAPLLLKEKSLVVSLKKMASEVLDKGGSFAFEKSLRGVFATMACHSVVRAGQALSREEMESLLKQMDEFPLSSFCPHGRPVYVQYPLHKLEKDFGRTQ